MTSDFVMTAGGRARCPHRAARDLQPQAHHFTRVARRGEDAGPYHLPSAESPSWMD